MSKSPVAAATTDPQRTGDAVSLEGVAQDTPVTVVVIDDDPGYRTLLRLLVPRQEPLAWAGEASDGSEGIELVRRSRPDIVVLDRQMPEMDGDVALRPIVAAAPDAMVVVHSSLPRDESAQALLRAGAFAYVSKADGGADLAAQLLELYAEFRAQRRAR